MINDPIARHYASLNAKREKDNMAELVKIVNDKAQIIESNELEIKSLREQVKRLEDDKEKVRKDLLLMVAYSVALMKNLAWGRSDGEFQDYLTKFFNCVRVYDKKIKR